MGPKECPETSDAKYISTLHYVPEERRFHLDRGGSVKLKWLPFQCLEILPLKFSLAWRAYYIYMT